MLRVVTDQLDRHQRIQRRRSQAWSEPAQSRQSIVVASIRMAAEEAELLSSVMGVEVPYSSCLPYSGGTVRIGTTRRSAMFPRSD